ncbi:MAG TPA: hypothetical protein VN426_16670 [Syntrophomonadaceae bacterium]|nr:hypothetical protein [Syntrophomonadaceae bacterium]
MMKNNRKLLSSIILILILLSICPASAGAQNQAAENRKVLILVMDYIDINDLQQARTPNLNLLLEQSGLGLMNIRAKNRDAASSYMSMVAGSRVAALPGSEWSFNSSETVQKLPDVYTSATAGPSAGQLYTLFTGSPAPLQGVVNLNSEPTRQYAASFSPPYQIGQLGKWARENALQVGVLGNADIMNSVDRDIAILAMDEKGIVPRGNVGQDILEKDPGSLGGLRNNQSAFLLAFADLWRQSAVLLVDLGDSSRVERSRENCSQAMLNQHRIQAIENNDRILGEIVKQVDLSSTLLLILTPNTNQDMLLAGNFGLTPVIARFPDGMRGLLTSPTTRRAGLVTNLDLLPTIQTYFSPSPAKGGMHIVGDSHSSLASISDQLSLFLRLRQSRDPLHFTFMFLLATLLITGYLFYILKKKHLRILLQVLLSASLSTPLVFLFLSQTGYRSIISSIALTLFLSLVVGVVFTSAIKKTTVRIGLLSAVTSVILIVDGFRGAPLMLLSPLGSDAIAGGRFYGIGNDYMGIILGSTLMAVMLGLNRMKMSAIGKMIVGLVPLTAAALVVGNPQYGANMGGLVTALAVIALFLVQFSGHRVGLKNYLVILFLAFLGTFAIALLDARLSATPSHAGKAISGFSNSGFALVWGMLQTKIGILTGTVAHSAWSLILAGGILVWLLSRSTLNALSPQMREKAVEMVQGFTILSLGSLTVFLVNDTGVIAAAFMLIYGIVCSWMGLEQIESDK